MKNLLKRIKLLLKIAKADIEQLSDISSSLGENQHYVIIDRADKGVVILNEGDKDFTAYPFNLTQEEFDDIMSREWEDE